ncbi:hypothetical protein HGA88_00905 [Candidatus Roizmanbacteria bacterium]|nr:hypothetical protein [Candidatus Roizmanbacteria bacterium]
MANYYQPSYSQTLDSEYSVKRSEAIQKEVPEASQFVARTMQQHNDYFVMMYREAQKNGTSLSEKDQQDYELAMLRERQGIVDPLPE